MSLYLMIKYICMYMPIPTDIKLYEQAKKIADKVYDKPSAYKSGYLVKVYKEMGGKFKGDKKKSSLSRWFAEQWNDVNPYKTKDSYPVYRPTKKVSKETPLTVQEIDPTDLRRKSIQKQKLKSKRLSPFKSK